jgi:putative acetyltransferase
MTELRILPMSMNDYHEAMALWRNTDGIGLSAADEPETMRAYLRRNPDLSQCARIGGELVGSVLAGHDGRRGYLHHLCVRDTHRGLGIGRMLVESALGALGAAGLDKAHAFLFSTNTDGRQFWERIGWTWRTDIGVVSRHTPGGAP